MKIESHEVRTLLMGTSYAYYRAHDKVALSVSHEASLARSLRRCRYYVEDRCITDERDTWKLLGIIKAPENSSSAKNNFLCALLLHLHLHGHARNISIVGYEG